MKLLLAISCLLLTSCGVIKSSSNPMIDKGIKLVEETWVEDGPFEENVEDAIEAVTGITIDISPKSEELE